MDRTNAASNLPRMPGVVVLIGGQKDLPDAKAKTGRTLRNLDNSDRSIRPRTGSTTVAESGLPRISRNNTLKRSPLSPPAGQTLFTGISKPYRRACWPVISSEATHDL